ncbi:MAG: SURF1 family protein [Cypionkella sp.]
MMRRMIGPLVFGVIGVAILIGLGVWQLERLKWKEAKLDAINAMLVDAPVALPTQVSTEADRYRGVTVAGRYTGEVVFKLDSLRDQGPGKRVIAVLEMPGGRRVLVDRGIWLEGTEATPKLAHEALVIGNLDWPQEVDSFTPAPDTKTGLWFARDVPAMAKALAAEPVLIVARAPTGDGIIPMPLDTSAIPNDHLQYAITWFSLALVWLVMTVLLLWRIRQQSLKAA